MACFFVFGVSCFDKSKEDSSEDTDVVGLDTAEEISITPCLADMELLVSGTSSANAEYMDLGGDWNYTLEVDELNLELTLSKVYTLGTSEGSLSGSYSSVIRYDDNNDTYPNRYPVSGEFSGHYNCFPDFESSFSLEMQIHGEAAIPFNLYEESGLGGTFPQDILCERFEDSVLVSEVLCEGLPIFSYFAVTNPKNVEYVFGLVE